MNDLALMFPLAPGSAEPIYRQLVAHVQRRVAAGHWQPGDEVPSVRELAQALAVNPMTVSKAYGLLEAQGVLERRRGLAMVVAERSARAAEATDATALLRPTLERAASEAAQLGLSPTKALALFKTILSETPSSEPT